MATLRQSFAETNWWTQCIYPTMTPSKTLSLVSCLLTLSVVLPAAHFDLAASPSPRHRRLDQQADHPSSLHDASHDFSRAHRHMDPSSHSPRHIMSQSMTINRRCTQEVHSSQRELFSFHLVSHECLASKFGAPPFSCPNSWICATKKVASLKTAPHPSHPLPEALPPATWHHALGPEGRYHENPRDYFRTACLWHLLPIWNLHLSTMVHRWISSPSPRHLCLDQQADHPSSLHDASHDFSRIHRHMDPSLHSPCHVTSHSMTTRTMHARSSFFTTRTLLLSLGLLKTSPQNLGLLLFPCPNSWICARQKVASSPTAPHPSQALPEALPPTT